MSIRARIFAVVGVVIAAAFVQAAVVLQVESRRRATSASLDLGIWRMENLTRLGRLVVELDGAQRAYAATGSPLVRDERERLWGLYERTAALLPRHLDSPDAQREFLAIDTLLREWRAQPAVPAAVSPATTAGTGDRPAASASPYAESAGALTQVRAVFDRLETAERSRFADERVKANSQSLQATLLMLGIPAGAIVMLLLLVALLARILLDPLAAIANSARQISGGTFDVSLPRESKDEIGDLVRAFHEMTTAVHRREREAAEALARERDQSEISAGLRVKAERDHRRLQATIETVPVGLVIVDAASGRIVLQNKTAGFLAGSEPEDAAAREAYWGAFRAATRDGAPVSVREWGAGRLLQGQEIVGEELVVTHPDGRAIPILLSAAPLREDDGRISGGVVAFQDITNLHEVDRLKSEFVSTVSHELRTPLTSIRGALQLLVNEGASAGAERAMLLHVALTNTERLVRIINDILDISKIEAGKLELHTRPHAVAEVVKLSLQNVEPIAHGSNVSLVTHIEDRAPDVEVDLDRTIQVIVNLLSNALKVAPPQSEVTLSAQRAGDGFVAFSVTDRGKGIPPEKIGLLFQKFQQLDGASTRRARGTGLGLAIVKALVEMQGGRVSVESTVGLGTTFTVAIPAAR